MSTAYSCIKCGAIFECRRNLQRHEERKTPCNPRIDPDETKAGRYACKHCGKAFNKASGMYRHANKFCKMRGEKGEDLKDRAIEVLQKRLKDLDEQSLKTEKKTLPEQKAQTIINGNGNTVNVTNNTIIIDQRKIQINIFGNETSEHITMADVARILSEGEPARSEEGKLLRAQNAIVAAAMLLHASEDAPANRNCFMNSEKDTSVSILRSGGWEKRPYKEISSAVAGKVVDLLFGKQPNEDPEMANSAATLRTLIDRKDALCYVRAPAMKPVFLANKGKVAKLLECDAESKHEEKDAPDLPVKIEDEYLEELYAGDPIVKALWPLTEWEALSELKEEGLEDEDAEVDPGVDSWKEKIAAKCVAKLRAWDKESKLQAWKTVGNVFWNVGKSLKRNAAQRARLIEEYCCRKAAMLRAQP